MIDSLSAIENLGGGLKWFKLIFDVVETKCVSFGAAQFKALEFRALGNTPTGIIGFEAVVPLDGWKNQELIGDLTVDFGRIKLRSLGAPTDRLLQVLEENFSLAKSGAQAAQEISCTAAFLADDPAEMETKEMHVKLFFDGAVGHDPESYAELYFNFDLSRRLVWLMEKDDSYRIPVVSWFAGRYRVASERLH